MYLLAKYKCECGCVSEYLSDTTATKIVCPNCGKPAEKELNDSILEVLRAMKRVPESDSFSLFQQVTFETDPFQKITKN